MSSALKEESQFIRLKFDLTATDSRNQVDSESYIFCCLALARRYILVFSRRISVENVPDSYSG